MTLLHRNWSGFFPFYTGSYDDEFAQGAAKGGKLFTCDLDKMIKCYWLAKSATITANLGYSNAVPSQDWTDSGTMTGSFTVPVTLTGERFGSKVMDKAPWARAAPRDWAIFPDPTDCFPNQNSELLSPDIFAYGFISTGTYNQGGGGVAYSGNFQGIGFLNWFAALAANVTTKGGGQVVYKTDTKKHYTRIDSGLFTGGPSGNGIAGYIFMDSNYISGAPTSGASLRLKMDGVTFATIPFFESPYDADSDIVTATTGTLDVDFNDFWTP